MIHTKADFSKETERTGGRPNPYLSTKVYLQINMEKLLCPQDKIGAVRTLREIEYGLHVGIINNFVEEIRLLHRGQRAKRQNGCLLVEMFLYYHNMFRSNIKVYRVLLPGT